MKKIPKHIIYSLMFLVFLTCVIYIVAVMLILAVILSPIWIPVAVALWTSRKLFDIDGAYDNGSDAQYFDSYTCDGMVLLIDCIHDYTEDEYKKELEMKKGLAHIVRYKSCTKCGHKVLRGLQ